jgi:tRNA(adenine34) deaminase
MTITARDSEFMGVAIALAEAAANANEVPVGAVVVLDGEIIGRGSNAPIATCDATAHAEIIALRDACQTAGNYRLTDVTLYATLEPCAMCAGAMVHARVARLVYGCADPRAGAAGSVFNIACSDALNHRVDVMSGVRAAECSDLLQRFFRARRK